MVRQQVYGLWANERNYQREPGCQGGILLNKDRTSSGLYPTSVLFL